MTHETRSPLRRRIPAHMLTPTDRQKAVDARRAKAAQKQHDRQVRLERLW
jgi:hypothetical protein